MAAGRPSKLSEEQRTFIVQQLACYATPTETAEAVHEQFRIEITPQRAEKFDHTKRAGRKCAKKWHVLFDATREAFVKHIADCVPEAHKAVRIQELAKAARSFKDDKKYIAMASMLEKIAKEVGGVYTNRHEFTGKDRGPIQFEDVSEMTTEMLESELDRLWAKRQGTEVPTPKPH